MAILSSFAKRCNSSVSVRGTPSYAREAKVLRLDPAYQAAIATGCCLNFFQLCGKSSCISLFG